MYPLFKTTVLWFWENSPEIASWILALGGIAVGIIPKWLEKQKISGRILLFICIVTGAAGLSASIRQKKQSNAQMTDLIGKTQTTLTNTNVTITKVTAVDSHMSDLGAQLVVALKNHDLPAITELQAQIKATQELSRTISRNLLRESVSSVASQLRAITVEWTNSPANREQIFDRYKAAINSAQSLRAEMLIEMGPPTSEDKSKDGLFAAATMRGRVDPQIVSEIIDYLQNLAGKLPPEK
jgi:hypothetical protein